MAPIVADGCAVPSLPLSDVPVRTAKADLSKPENREQLYIDIGVCLDVVRRDAGLNLDEFACALGKNSRQVARWMLGTERPQIEAVFAVARFRSSLVIALARLAGDIDVTTTITVRRVA